MTYATASTSARPSFIDGVTNADLAATILRVSMGGLFLAHAGALLHKSPEGQSSPFRGRTYPLASVMGVPSAVKPFRTATRTWNSAT